MMTDREQAILDGVNANHHAALYRCRWSAPDAQVVVPQLVSLLTSGSPEIVDDALRALFLIGTPAESAAPGVAALLGSSRPITKSMAVLALGQIAHRRPELCVGPLTATLTDESCCRNALRILAYIGAPAKCALEEVLRLYSKRDAKIRKAVVLTAVAIGAECGEVVVLLKTASSDRSKIVRDAARRAAGQRGTASTRVP